MLRLLVEQMPVLDTLRMNNQHRGILPVAPLTDAQLVGVAVCHLLLAAEKFPTVDVGHLSHDLRA